MTTGHPISRHVRDTIVGRIGQALSGGDGSLIFVAGDGTFLADEVERRVPDTGRKTVVTVRASVKDGELSPEPAVVNRRSAKGALVAAELVGTVISPWLAIAGSALVASSIVGELAEKWRSSRARSAADQVSDAWFILQELSLEHVLVLWVDRADDSPDLLTLFRLGYADYVISHRMVVMIGLATCGSALPGGDDPLRDASALCRQSKAEWLPISALSDGDIRSWLGQADADVVTSLAQYAFRNPAATEELWDRWKRQNVVATDQAARWVFASDAASRVTAEIGHRLSSDLDESGWSAADVLDLLRIARLEGDAFTAADVALAGKHDPDDVVDLLDSMAGRPEPLVTEVDPHPGHSALPWRYRIASPLLLAAASQDTRGDRERARQLLIHALHRAEDRDTRRNADLARLAFLAGEPGLGTQLTDASRAVSSLAGRVAHAEVMVNLPTSGWSGPEYARAASILTRLVWSAAPAIERARVDRLASAAITWSDRSLVESLRADARSACGYAHVYHGAYDQAVDLYTQALTINRAIGNRHGESTNLSGLAECHRSQGRCDQAVDLYTQALTIDRAIGRRQGESINLAPIGLCEKAIQEHAQRSTGPRVLLSYRRDDSSHATGRLRERLCDQFAPGNVFYDVGSIPVGSEFPTTIKEAIAHADVVLVLIGAGWDPERLQLANAFVRLEIAEAFRHSRRVVPILIDNAVMPSADRLPDELHKLPNLNAAHLRRDPDFGPDCDAIIALVRDWGNPSST